MRTSHSPTAGSTGARALKGLGSLLVLVGVVGGLPLLLSWATPVIWEASHHSLAHLLERQDTGAVFLLLLVAVGWIGWAQFTWCAARELVAQLRGRTWQPPRGLGASQRAAAVLIGGILVLLPTSSALASPAQASTVSTTHVPGPAHVSQQTAAADQTEQSGPEPVASPTRTVEPGESLWSIAEKDLGDGEQWRTIAALNEGHVMHDGQTFTSTSFLQTGWELRMPTVTGPPASPPATGTGTQMGGQVSAEAGQGEHVVTVESGDYLSKIAEEELGDGNDWPKLFAASHGKPQPTGLPEITDPDVIYAGQQITVPTNGPGQHDGPSPDRQPDESNSQPPNPPAAEVPQESQGSDASISPDSPSAPANEPSTPSDPTNSPTGQPSHSPADNAPQPTTPRPGASTAEPAARSTAPAAPTTAPAAGPAQAASPLQLRTVLGAGALLAAAVTGALAVRRTLQRRRRKPGEKIAIAPQTSPAEAQLAAVGEPHGAARLDVALRTLAHLAEQNGTELPTLRAARIGSRSVAALPEDLSHQPMPPFTTWQAGWWQLAADAELLNADDARDIRAPYPGLVTVGSTPEGDLVLANLAQIPALLLDGNPVHITEVCTSLALELGMSPWAHEVEVVTIGFGEDLPQLLPTSRIAHMRQPAHALGDLTERLLEAHQMPETAHQPSLLLCAAAMDPDVAWEFADVIDKAGRVPVTLIAPATAAAAHFPEADILNASLDTPQPFDHLGTDITVQRLEHAAYQQITAALALSGQPAQEPEGPWKGVPDELAVNTATEPDPAEQTPAAETNAQCDTPPVSAAPVGQDEAVFPALLAASASPSSLRLLPGHRHGETDPCSGTEEPRPATPQKPGAEDSAITANDKPLSSADQAPHHAGSADTDMAARDLHAPEIRVLGPVEVDRVGSTGHGPRIAQLAALMFFRPGRTADVMCADMDPITPWSVATLNARLQGLRRALGNDATGNAYVPRRRSGEDPYLLAPTVRCDWTRFLQLAEQALPQAAVGLPDLEKALSLVRGRPFGTRPLPWAEPYQQEMLTRIVDVAHTVAAYRTASGPHHDLSAARRAIATGLEADETAELLYRDWMKIEWVARNRSGLHTAISRLQQVNQALDCDLELETEQLISDLLSGSGSTLPKAF
ncbi:LysM peptidoglycan-binding domain-containing protein [Streptomyces sp. NPDC127084]|uniref:LysM peptidoglycan-binding domain-containing protein n=1 Tax=Streptomyces sp. NPDC127084 TaxID=3347133 RepID=UPI0036474391